MSHQQLLSDMLPKEGALKITLAEFFLPRVLVGLSVSQGSLQWACQVSPIRSKSVY